MEEKDKRYAQTKIDLIIEEDKISNKDFVEICDNIKISRKWRVVI